MDHNKRNPTRLDALPQDVLGYIAAIVAAESAVGYINTVLCCKILGSTREDERVLRNLSLEPLKRNPLTARSYRPLMNKLLANNNTDVHYIKGVLSYFQHGHKRRGLIHLQRAADAGNSEAIYVYALLMMGTGKFERGKLYFSMLKLEEDVTIAMSTWVKVRETLAELMVVTEPSYYAALQRLGITIPCDLISMDIVCHICFYYKAMFKFIMEI